MSKAGFSRYEAFVEARAKANDRQSQIPIAQNKNYGFMVKKEDYVCDRYLNPTQSSNIFLNIQKDNYTSNSWMIQNLQNATDDDTTEEDFLRSEIGK